MNLSEISRTLREIRVSPVKSLGQNFLHDQNLARWIVNQADLTADDYVVEIGPGLGALTEFVLPKAACVLAIEKDARLANYLRAHFPADQLEVRHEDALDFDVRTLFAKPKIKLIANLPYNVSSQLILKYLEFPSPISLALLMLQREMAERLCASPSTKSYGAISVWIQFYYHVEYLRKIPASVFLPSPEVDSAMIRMRPRKSDELPTCDPRLFHKLVRAGFSQRRKQLGKLLRPEITDWPRAAEAVGLDLQVRAEALSLEQWVVLTNYLRPINPAEAAAAQDEMFPVVDEEDRLAGAAPRSKVHGDNLRHRAVHILIFRKNGDLFLQKRSRWKDRHPGTWDSSAAGHVNAGEDYDVAAQRELKEELGIEAPLERVVKLPASENTGQEFIWLYRGRHDGELALDPGEIEAGRFFPPRLVSEWIEARPEDFAPGFVECWTAYTASPSA
jgi:16S rRNA (adenine1518-N6/adenine1519-N6)-dimethyltransferase